MTVLFPLDLTEPRATTDAALAFAERLGGELLALHIVAPLTPGLGPDAFGGGLGFEGAPYAMLDPALQRSVEAAEETAFGRFVRERFPPTVRAALRQGDPVEVILDEAKAVGADLVVVGHHHQGFLSNLLGGSVAGAVLKRAAFPLLVLPDPAGAG